MIFTEKEDEINSEESVSSKESSKSKKSVSVSDSDSISQLSEEEMNVSQLKHGKFSINLGGKKFESLAFLTKFVSHFKKIG